MTPPTNSLKINTDGVKKGDCSAIRSVARDFKGYFIFGFFNSLTNDQFFTLNYS